DHNWKAFVDGKGVPVLRANEAFQAIEIPAGKHAIRFIYRSNSFYAGAALSGIGLFACAIIFRLNRKESPNHIDSK
ncbi:MAG: YfhO family protein, partial [Limisphaerales bacterium]